MGKVTLTERPSGVVILSLGEPGERVVSLNRERLLSFRDAVRTLAAKPPKGVVIAGTTPEMFCVGADITLISSVTEVSVGYELAKIGQTVFDELEALPCRTVAAIGGPCVGGGCELVLACQERIISSQRSSIIGLPEVKLGILPGFGGTQRMPRLIGLPAALDLILAGKTLKAKDALRVGLVGAVVDSEDLLKEAEAVASGEKPIRKPRWGAQGWFLTNTAIGRSIVTKSAGEKVAKQTKGYYPAPPAALKACVYGLSHGLKAGYEHEAKELGRLITTPESKALVRLFFMSEASKAIGKSARQEVSDIQALVVGSGVMGSGIAGSLASSDCRVILRDSNEEALSKARKSLGVALDKRRNLSPEDRSLIMNRISFSSSSNAIAGCSIAIEAIVEQLDAKQSLFKALADQLPATSILATNTSSLPVTHVAAGIPSPERVVGMHFFNPVDRMPLVEIIRAKETSDKTIAFVAALANKLGKSPIVVNDVPGFLVNRILTPYLNEAAFLAHEGYHIGDIDKAALAFGMPMGPFRLLDEVGLDVAHHVSEIMLAGYGERMKAPDLTAPLLALGRKGKKSGCGFYQFLDGESLNPTIHVDCGLKGERRPSDASIQERLILALVNEASRCLDEGVAGVPGVDAVQQIDLGTVMGIGFPAFRGGILFYAENFGLGKIVERMNYYASQGCTQLTPWRGIVERASHSAQSKFYQQ